MPALSIAEFRADGATGELSGRRGFLELKVEFASGLIVGAT